MVRRRCSRRHEQRMTPLGGLRQIMGQVVVTVMEEAVGEEWSNEMEKAWLDLWNTCCTAMMKAIKEAESHGQVVEDVWRNVTKKITPERFGVVIVNHMQKHDSELVRRFTYGYMEDKKSHDNDGENMETSDTPKTKSGWKVCYNLGQSVLDFRSPLTVAGRWG